MFNRDGKIYSKISSELLDSYKKIQVSLDDTCLLAGNTEATLRESFRFIKEKQDLDKDDAAKINIIMGIFIQQNLNNIDSTSVFTETLISGIITKVCDTYSELSYINSSGKLIKTSVFYNSISYFYSDIISKNLEEYLSSLNSFPALCKCQKDTNYKILERLSKILDSSSDTKKYLLILEGLLAGGIHDILIARNLIIVNNLSVVPVTSISGFLQTGDC